tara:strand:- start:21 stop:737 length:717 start_codon:yes stop_codon:yes gene_type:complete
MRISIAKLIINSFDYLQQKKIFVFLKKKLKKNAILFDVGAHHGETINNFIKYFDFSNIHSFEASNKNFKTLKNKIKKHLDNRIFLNNFGLSDLNKSLKIKQFQETSSTTLSKINRNSKYFKRKIKVLGLKENKKIYENCDVELNQLDNYCEKNKINKIDLLKIDTEGHEYFVIKGSINTLKKIKYIYFEHHYDDMLIKGYKYSDIHDLLKKHNFVKIFKSKMFFRKTFEYIYENSKLD